MSDVRQVGMRLLIAIAAALVLLTGCDYNDDDHDDDHDHDDYIVSFTSDSSERVIDIHRASGQPFDVIEIGVTPFVDSIFGDYIFSVSGISWVDGDEFIIEIPDDIQQAFINPFRGEPLEDVGMICDCVIDYVILRSEFGSKTLLFD